MNKWEKEAGIVFLIQNDNLKDLYSFLGCDSKDEVDVYCDIIFERFQEMTKEARMVHIEFVRRLLNKLEIPLLEKDTLCFKIKKDKLVQGLYVLEFDLGRDGSPLRRASSLYDPSNEVFNVMFENQQEKFPTEPFCDPHIWLSFLRKIGLIHKVTNELFLQFAHEVEREGRTSSANTKTKAKSETLVAYLFKKENLATNPILDNVKDICFIFPKEIGDHLKQVHKPFGRQPCVCFKGSVASPRRHFTIDIAWTTVSILPDYANPFTCHYFNPQYDRGSKLNNRNNYMKEIISRLGILESPTVEMLVNHCKNICHALCQRNDDAANRVDNSQNRNLSQNTDVVIEVMKSIYKFLQDKYRNNESVHVIKAGLQNTRCIVVEDGKRFVYPRQVVVEMMPNDEIHPHLFKVPRQFADYVDLFENLGSTVTVTAAQYAMVLDNMHMECGDDKLHLNEKTNAFKATKGLFESIVKDGEKPLEIQTLYLPGVKRNLDGSSLYPVFIQKSTEIFYNDAPHFKDRLKGFQKLLLVKLKQCGLKVDNDDF